MLFRKIGVCHNESYVAVGEAHAVLHGFNDPVPESGGAGDPGSEVTHHYYASGIHAVRREERHVLYVGCVHMVYHQHRAPGCERAESGCRVGERMRHLKS